MDASKYAVNYNDERLTSIKAEQAQEVKNTNETYNNMISNSDKFYQDQINASKEYAAKQQQIQQENTNFAIDKINQEKEKTERDYTKEQKGAYADYAKQVNDYGVNAEKNALSGLSNSGYSESSKVSMYNTYQNRVATARESLNNAMVNYNNSIKEAQLANNSKLAEIAYNALQEQLQLSLQGFQYKNTLIQAKQSQLNYIGESYDTRYQNMLGQINAELARQKEIDEFNENMLLQYKELNERMRQASLEHERWMTDFKETQRQNNIKNQQWEKEYALSKKKAKTSSGGSYISVNNGRSASNSNSSNAVVNGALSAFVNPQVSVAKALENQVLNGSISREDASKYISNLKWV